MRIATWNVNSLKARQEAVEGWLDRAAPDILLHAGDEADRRRRAGHGVRDGRLPARPPRRGALERRRDRGPRWARDRRRRHELRRRAGPGFRSGRRRRRTGLARRTSTRSTRRGCSRRPSTGSASSACTRRTAGSSARRSTPASWPGSSASRAGSARRRKPGDALLLGGDLNVAPTDDDVWDPTAVHGGTHVSEPERAAFRALLDLGLTDGYRARHDEPGRFSWWDYRAGMFHKNFGMRIDHLLASAPVAARIVDAEIDREARKGPPVPSDHAPLTIDLDEPGRPIDPTGPAPSPASPPARRPVRAARAQPRPAPGA